MLTMLTKEMATLQDLEQREEELRKTEEEAKLVSQEKIPQRRYGSRITPEIQKQYIERRNKAREVLVQVKKQREELRPIREQAMREQEERDLAQKRLNDYEKGYKLGLKRLFPYKLNTEQQRGYSDAIQGLRNQQQRNEYFQKVKELEAQGLKPIYSEGNLVGFEDEVRKQTIPLENVPKLPEKDITRYEKVGIVERTSTPNKYSIPDFNVLKEQQLKLESQKRYKPFFEKVEDVIKYPFEKVANYNEKATRYAEEKLPFLSGVSKVNQYASTKLISPIFIKEGEGHPSTQGIKALGEFIAYPVYGVKQIERYSFDKEFRGEFKNLPTTQKALEVGNVALSLYALYSVGSVAKEYALKPINVREEIKLPEQYLTETKIKNIRVGEKAFDIAQYRVTQVSFSVRAYQVPRYAKILRGITENKISKLSFEELNLAIPEGKVIELKKLQINQAVTEPFIIKEGKIIRAVQRARDPRVFSYRAYFNRQTGRYRLGKRDISILYSENYGSRAARTLSKTREELPTNIKVALKELEKIEGPKGLEIKKVFGKEQDLQIGGVVTEDIFRLTNKGLKLTSEYKIKRLKELKTPLLQTKYFEEFPKLGKTINRAEVIGVQKSLKKINFNNREYGLKEYELLKEDLAAVDITLPKLRGPRKATRLRGIVERKEYEFPSKEPLGVFEQRGGTGKTTELKFERLELENQKTLQKAIGTTGIKLSKSPTKITRPKVETKAVLDTPSISAFAGTGLYERTETETARVPGQTLNKGFSREVPSYRLITPVGLTLPTKTISRGVSKEVSKELSKEISKELSKEISKELSKELPKLAPKEITKQTSKQTQKQVSKISFKYTPKTNPLVNLKGTPRIKTIKTGTKIPPLFLKGDGKTKQISKGYKPFVIKGGKKLYLGGGVLPKGKALRLAEIEAKRSLRATFGVEPTKLKTTEKDIKFTPQKKLFRNYRIKQGKRVPLKDTFIQKLGKRLTFNTEIAEIQSARKRSKLNVRYKFKPGNRKLHR